LASALILIVEDEPMTVPAIKTFSAPPRENPSLWSMAVRQFDLAADKLDLDPRLRVILGECKRELAVNFPVKLGDGRTRVFTGYRVHHNVNRGPAKGGVRYHPDVTIDQVKAFAMEMSWKSAVINVPFGGGAGGIVVDPASLSRQALERLTRRFATEIELLIGPDRDIPGTDIGTNSQVMAWMMDTFSMHRGHTVTGVVTGKPVSIGGSAQRDESAGLGIQMVVQAAARHLGLPLEGATVVVQGYGNAGTYSASLLHEHGCKIIAVSDTQGGILSPRGLDPLAVERFKRESGSVIGYTGTDQVTNEELLELPCDILIPAALEAQITDKNAPAVKARIVAEAANMPTTPEADDILFANGVFVIPDIVANAAGVALSYFEWVQDLQSFFWDEDEIKQRLETIVTHAFNNMVETATKGRVNNRTAAIMIAVNRVAEATQLRGIYP
jgi:glutamate dehydrogenase (NAD(P)+)